VGILLACAVPGWLRARDWRRSGRPIADRDVALSVARAARSVGLRREPRVLAVAELPGPLVTGLLHPCVLIPAAMLGRLRPEELEMALAHEMAHIARGDLWWGLVPALARRIFFFHPAAWLAEREYALAREAACDEAVLRPGADAFLYGQLLLRFATRAPASTSLPMSPPSMLRRRLEMIEAVVRRVPLARAGWAFVAVAALALVPVRLVASEARGFDPRGFVEAMRRNYPTLVNAVDLRDAASPETGMESGETRCLEIGKNVDTAYVITNGKRHTMCGDVADVREAMGARGAGGEVIWFRVGSESFVIRDPEAVAQGRRYFAAIDLIGEQQSEIGMEQSRIGMEQAKIGAQQADEGYRQAAEAMRKAEEDLARQHEVATEVQKRQHQAAEEEAQTAHEKASADADRDRKRLAEQMEVLSQRMQELSGRQDEFGEKQRELGERMNRELVEVQRALSEFLEGAIKDGRAQRAN
jgi:hypothetical protein